VDFTYFSLNPQQLADAATYVRQRSEQIEAKLAEIRHYVASLEDCWQGMAHTQFLDLMATYDRKATQLREVLASIGVAMQGNHDVYHDTDHRNSTVFGGIQFTPGNF
jgi:WXG100 family type VII secretion target